MEEAYVPPRSASIEDPLRIAVLISGGGSGLAALLRYQEDEARTHQTVLVLADSEGAGGLEHARSREIENYGIPLPNMEDKQQRRLAHEELVHMALVNADVELVVLSGYMRILHRVLSSDGKVAWLTSILLYFQSILGPMLTGMHWPMEQPFQVAQFTW